MKSQFRGLMLVVTVLLLCAVLGAIYGPNVRATSSSSDDYQSAVRDFTRVLDVVQNNYAEPVDVDKAVYQGAIPGMLRMLDPHSNFFDAKQFALLREDQRGKYYGVGMVVAPRENHTVVMAPYVGAPAYNAGLRPGDIIKKVDEKVTDGLTTSEVADLLKGPKGTVVKITVAREGYTEPLVFTVTRDEKSLVLDLTLAWKGAVLGVANATTVRWRFDEGGPGVALIMKDDAAVSASQDEIDVLTQYFKAVVWPTVQRMAR